MTGLQDRLSPQQIEDFGRDLDELRQRTVADLGAEDVKYIQDVIKTQRALEVVGRGLLFAGFFPPAWVAGVGALSLSKILDNMEIGHNVMHGQYDWTRDPALSSSKFEWDNVTPGENWRHSHNYMHHTYTNILDKDRDVGYGILRIDPAQKWHPYYLGNPVYALALAFIFQWGVMLHDLEFDRIVAGERKWSDNKDVIAKMVRKATRQVGKDYILFPLLTGPMAPLTLLGNATANLSRNLWAFSIIFCGHFPADVESFTEEETENESRGQWYLRQILGSANITGGKLFHVLSGNLSHQIEHHLFPDIPARRYPQIAGEVRAICERYGLPYNTGPLHRQLGQVAKKLVKLAMPWNGAPREPQAPRTVERDRRPSAA